MLIREHVLVLKHCRFCGGQAKEDGSFPDTLSCVLREDGINSLAPEPKRREIACEDNATIAKRLAELAGAREEAAIASGCAVMQGRPMEECRQCNDPPRDCFVCAIKKNQPVASCLYCYNGAGTASKACPSRLSNLVYG